MRSWRRCSGSAIAPTLFGIALLCCGLNSTVTATLSGQIVMEGFIDIRLPAWARRLVTRVDRHRAGGGRHHLVWRGGHGEAADPQPGRAGLQLPFSIVPLVMFTADRRKMGELVGAALGDRAGGADGGGADRAEHQAAGRPDSRLRPVTFPRGSSRRASAVPAAGSGPCSPSCASPRPNSRGRRKAGPCGVPARYDRGS